MKRLTRFFSIYLSSCLLTGMTSPMSWGEDARPSGARPIVCVEADASEFGGTPGALSGAAGHLGAAEDSMPQCGQDPAASLQVERYLEDVVVAPLQGRNRVVDTVMGTVEPLVGFTVNTSQDGVLAPPGMEISALTPEKPVAAVDDVGRTIEAWMAAWSGRNPDAYLGYYSPEFSTGEPGFSFAQWSQQRRQRILKQPWIAVKAHDLRVEPAGTDQVTVRFKQDYRSPSISEVSNKRLLLKRQGSSWRILSERSE